MQLVITTLYFRKLACTGTVKYKLLNLLCNLQNRLKIFCDSKAKRVMDKMVMDKNKRSLSFGRSSMSPYDELPFSFLGKGDLQSKDRRKLIPFRLII